MAAAFALGAGMMAVELPTAFPVLRRDRGDDGLGPSLGTPLALVVAYNIAFVLPLVAIIVVRMAACDALVYRLHHCGTWLAHHAKTILAALVGPRGVALIAYRILR